MRSHQGKLQLISCVMSLACLLPVLPDFSHRCVADAATRPALPRSLQVRMQSDGRLVAAGKLDSPRYNGIFDAFTKIR